MSQEQHYPLVTKLRKIAYVCVWMLKAK